MRVFVAIIFSREVKDKIYAVEQKLKAECAKGRFTNYDNLHLTLVFIGEKDDADIERITALLDKIEFKPFAFTISGMGNFRRAGGGDIYWLGVKSEEVYTLRKQIHGLLKDFNIEPKFAAHITLGREVAKKNSAAISYDEIKAEALQVDLMKSERVDSKLTYTPIFSKTLK
jgi:2'-5' RNA ligase